MAVNEGNLWICGVRHWKGPKICPPGPAGDRHHHHAGTGSEVDATSVITNQETHEKIGLKFPDLYPCLAIVDPELMLTVPPRLTAFQGFDALFHSLETYVNRKANLMSDMVASTAIRNIGASFPGPCPGRRCGSPDPYGLCQYPVRLCHGPGGLHQ